MKPRTPPPPIDAARRAFLGAAAAAPLAAAAPAVAAPAQTATAATSPQAARYRDTAHVRTYYRLAEY